jgi:hypothetical protein
MKFRKSANRSASFGKMLLFCCIVLGLITALSSAAALEKEIRISADMGNYASLGFNISPQVVVEPEAIIEANYTSGREVAASILLDGKRVELHLIYPCQEPQKELKPAELKPYLTAYDSILAKATYNESEQGPALLGQIGNRNLIAYQPNNLTIAMVLMDINMSTEMVATFLGNLSIIVNESVAPPGNCPDTTAATVASAETAVPNNPALRPVADNGIAPAVNTKESLASGKQKMASDMAAARAKLLATRETMKRS